MINRICLFVLIGITSLFATTSTAQERKKIAVVLSGGGAKGMAHIGALKIIEEALASDLGYTPSQLDSIVRRQEWSWLLSDKTETKKLSLDRREEKEKYIISIPFDPSKKQKMDGLIQGENLNALFSDLTIGYHDSIDFKNLPIPFACVATDIVSGNEIVFHKGVLSAAIRASMAIPGVFTPIRKDSMVLVDGGLKNNYPADVAKQMGADLIIGVSVQSEPQKAEKLNKVTDILTQVIDFACKNKFESNKELTDLFIQIDTEGYTAGSFSKEAIDSLILRGEEAARSQLNALYSIKEKAGYDKAYIPHSHGPYKSLSSIQRIFINNIYFTDIGEREISRILRKSRLKEHNLNSVGQIENALNILREEMAYTNVYYTLKETQDGNNLYFHQDNKMENRLNVGIRFDSEDIPWSHL